MDMIETALSCTWREKKEEAPLKAQRLNLLISPCDNRWKDRKVILKSYSRPRIKGLWLMETCNTPLNPITQTNMLVQYVYHSASVRKQHLTNGLASPLWTCGPKCSVFASATLQTLEQTVAVFNTSRCCGSGCFKAPKCCSAWAGVP